MSLPLGVGSIAVMGDLSVAGKMTCETVPSSSSEVVSRSDLTSAIGSHITLF